MLQILRRNGICGRKFADRVLEHIAAFWLSQLGICADIKPDFNRAKFYVFLFATHLKSISSLYGFYTTTPSPLIKFSLLPFPLPVCDRGKGSGHK